MKTSLNWEIGLSIPSCSMMDAIARVHSTTALTFSFGFSLGREILFLSPEKSD